MPWRSEVILQTEDKKEIYVYNTQNPANKHLAYKIDKKKAAIEFYPQDRFIPGKIILDGFKELPVEFYKNQARRC